MKGAEETLRRLRRQRPRDRALGWHHTAFGAMLLGPWILGGFDPFGLLTERRLVNLKRFLSEAVPYPLQGEAFDLGILGGWVAERMTTKGAEAMATTLAISVVAILLAGLGGAVLGLGGARTLATPEAYLPRLRKPPRRLRLAWRGLVWLSRGAMIVLRAIPAYLWAFLLLALLGPTAWPAILALAFHNAGILGKLSSEVVENLDPRTPSALRALGASRAQVTMTALFPAAFPRMLLFFFYRWETCVRQATILGLLGIVSLGYWIQDARARNHYDEMLFYVLLGSVLVLAGDVVSLAVREWLRRST